MFDRDEHNEVHVARHGLTLEEAEEVLLGPMTMTTMQDTELKTIRSIDQIPPFANEAEEAEFWDTHQFSDKLWDNAEPFGPDELPLPHQAGGYPLRLDEPTVW